MHFLYSNIALIKTPDLSNLSKIGKWIEKPYQKDPYLIFANTCLSREKAPVIVDVGSNIGTTVLPLANQLSNVTFINAAIGKKEGLAQIYTRPSNSGGHRLTGFDKRKDLKGLYFDSKKQPDSKYLKTLLTHLFCSNESCSKP